jgi:hypothetical protein
MPFVRCPTVVLVVVHAIAVPVIRDGEGGVLKHPRAVRQAQQVIVSGAWQTRICGRASAPRGRPMPDTGIIRIVTIAA